MAQAIGVSHQTVFNWTRFGRLPSYSCEDGRRRYDLADGVAAKAKTKPAMKREQGIPDPDHTIVGFCYSDAYGNIRVRFKDIMGKTHDAHVSSAEQALPAEDYYAKPVTAIGIDDAGNPATAMIDLTSNVTVEATATWAKATPHNTISVPDDLAGFSSRVCETRFPEDRSVLDKITGEAAKQFADKAFPTTGVPNDIAPPPPVAFEFDDDGA